MCDLPPLCVKVSDSGAKVCDLPPLYVNISDSGAKMGNLPPMVSENGYSGVKVCDLPPMTPGSISLCGFCWFYDTVVAGYGRFRRELG